MRLLIDILLVSIICNGWYIITHDGMILDPVRKAFINLLNGIEKSDGNVSFKKNLCSNEDIKWKKFLYKPIFHCIICMSSIIGSFAYWTLHKFTFTESALIYWPIICISASYGNYLLYLILRKLEE